MFIERTQYIIDIWDRNHRMTDTHSTVQQQIMATKNNNKNYSIHGIYYIFSGW